MARQVAEPAASSQMVSLVRWTASASNPPPKPTPRGAGRDGPRGSPATATAGERGPPGGGERGRSDGLQPAGPASRRGGECPLGRQDVPGGVAGGGEPGGAVAKHGEQAPGTGCGGQG